MPAAPSAARLGDNRMDSDMPEPRATILVIGQANAGNHGPVRAQGGPAMRVFHEGSFLPACDPLPGASGGGGSVWTRFGPKAVAAGLCREVVLVNVAHGDTAATDWTPGGRLHSRLAGALRKAEETGLAFTQVVWFQGERDTLMGTSGTSYAARLAEIVSWLRGRGVSAPVFVCRTSLRAGRRGNGVRAAQNAAIDPRSGIFAGPDSDLIGPERRTDGTQLDADGQEAFAEMLVQAMVAAQPQQAETAAA